VKDVRKFRRSFRFAYEGLKYALSTQQNMQFHFSAALIALMLGLLFELPKTEILFIMLSATLVIVCELVNTAVEKTVDLAMPEHHPIAKIAKDVAAAAVLVSAVFAAVVGMVVFFDPIDRLFRQAGDLGGKTITPGLILAMVAVVALTITIAQTRFSGRKTSIRPSLIAAVSFAFSTWIAMLAENTLIALLGFGLSLQLIFVLYEKQNRTLPSIIAGALAGSAMTALAFSLMHYF
jgi:undecaprenol kinase/diacylglycerol kinase (ATP)